MNRLGKKSESRFVFNKSYFKLFISILIIEIIIALYVKDRIIRPNIGDFLVVILLYSLLKSFLKISVNITISVVLLFSFFVEFLQYLKIIEILKIQNNRFLSIIIGNSFSVTDLVCYTLGLFLVVIVEKIRFTKKQT